MINMKQIKIQDFLTEQQIQSCAKLYPNVDAIEHDVIAPNMQEINRKIGQENDSRYIAYAVHFAFGLASRRMN